MNNPNNNSHSSPKKIKGILKQPSSDSKHKEKQLLWDEEKLAETEAGKGGRMKIDEPKTPFRRAGSHDEEEYQKEIEEMLESAKKDLEHADHKADFEAKRKMHYQKEEGEVLRKLKAKKMLQKEQGISDEESDGET